MVQTVVSREAVKRVLGRGRGVEPGNPAMGAYGFSTPRPVPLFSLKPVPSPRLASMGRKIFQSVVRGRREEDHQVMEDSPDAMDTHLHLDRTLRRFRLEPSTGMQEFLAKCPAPSPGQRVNLVGGVLVFCDPKTWPNDPEQITSGKRIACTGGYWGRCWKKSLTQGRGFTSTISTRTWPQSSSDLIRTLKPTLVST